MSYIGKQPSPAALTASDITDGIISEAKMADDAISLTELKAGTDGNIISYDTSGNPVAVATGDDGQVLTSAGAGQPPAFEDSGSMVKLLETSCSNSNISITGYFTSDYDVYKLYMDGFYNSAYDGDCIRMKVATAANAQEGTGYSYASYGWTSEAETNIEDNTDHTYTRISGNQGQTATSTGCLELTIFDPLGSNVKNFIAHSVTNEGDVTDNIMTMSSVTWDSTTALTGLFIYFGSSNLTCRKIRLYGIKN